MHKVGIAKKVPITFNLQRIHLPVENVRSHNIILKCTSTSSFLVISGMNCSGSNQGYTMLFTRLLLLFKDLSFLIRYCPSDLILHIFEEFSLVWFRNPLMYGRCHTFLTMFTHNPFFLICYDTDYLLSIVYFCVMN
jgi:hypothetical protein